LRNPGQYDHLFRSIPIAHSDLLRSLIPRIAIGDSEAMRSVIPIHCDH
jgi:hypothetical protein